MTRPRDWAPLAAGDPTPGDPDAVARLAARFTGTAEAIALAVKSLREIHDSGTTWESGAGEAFKTKTRETADTIEKAHRRYAATAEALRTYGSELAVTQEDADALLAKAKTAQGAADDAKRKLDQATTSAPTPDDPTVTSARDGLEQAQAEVERLRRQLPAIRTAWDDAGRRAAGAIEDVVESDGLNDGFWDDFLGVVEVITDIAGKLSAIFGVIALICSVIPGLQPFAALFGALALITGLVSLAGNITLYANGKATLSDVLWDVVSVLSFGAGRAFALAGRSLAAAGRGLAKPTLIRSLRAGGMSHRGAQRAARARGITGGGREAKQAARAFTDNPRALPTFREWTTAFTKPFTGVRPSLHVDLPADIRAMPPVSTALRNAANAERAAVVAGIAGNVADGRTVHDMVPSSVPVIGRDDSPVERNR